MGNVCGCVREPKEECYVDPKNAPLNPGSKELRGRQYFQRKKRKSEDSKPNGPVRSSPGEVLGSSAVCKSSELQDDPDNSSMQNQAVLNKISQVDNQLTRQGSLSKDVFIGEVTDFKDYGDPPLGTRLQCRLGSLSTDLDDDLSCRAAVEKKLHGVSTTSRAISAKDGPLLKKLLQRQLRRAVSFGAVEQMLRTLNGNEKPGSEEMFAKIICGCQVHRRTRHRTYTFSGYSDTIPASAKSVSTQNKVKRELAINT